MCRQQTALAVNCRRYEHYKQSSIKGNGGGINSSEGGGQDPEVGARPALSASYRWDAGRWRPDQADGENVLFVNWVQKKLAEGWEIHS
jgi:hypothetical protein